MKCHRVFLALAALGLAAGCNEQGATHEQTPTRQAQTTGEPGARLKAGEGVGGTATITVTITDTLTGTATSIVTVTSSSTATATQTATATATMTLTGTITQTATSTQTSTRTRTAAGTTATKTASARSLNVTGTSVGIVTMRNDYVPARSYVWTATLTRAETAPTTFNGSGTATGTYVDTGVTYTGSGTTTSMMQFSSFATATTTRTVPANFSGALSKTVLSTGTGYGWMGSITWTYTKTATGTHTATVTQTNTATVTNTPTVTSTATNTVTTTSTLTVTTTGSNTATGTITTSSTATRTDTATSTDVCTQSYQVAGAPNPDVGAVLEACPDLASSLLWVDAANVDVPYASWPSAMMDRLAVLYAQMLVDAPLTDLACPDPRGTDRVRFPTAANMPDGTPMEVYFTLPQATDIYLASVAHALALEVRQALPWSLRGYPALELEPLLSARSLFVPVTQPPHPFGGTPIPDVAYQAPMAHDAHGFVCDPRIGYDFIRGTTSTTGQDLVAGSATETLAQLTFFLTQNSVHGFPLGFAEPISTFQFTLGERLHLGLLEPDGTPAPWIIARLGCHSTAETLEELARAVNIPLRNVASYDVAWTDGTDYPFRANTHRGLAYAWTRPAERRILPHADYVDATALWPNYRQPFTALDYFNIAWRTPESYQGMGMQVDMSMPIVPILPANSKGSFETYFDFGRVLAVLGSGTIAEGRYYLRTDACSWDLAAAYCKDPLGGVAAFQANNPYGGYPQFSDAALLQASYDAIAACIAALPAGCSAVPASYPDFVATNYLP